MSTLHSYTYLRCSKHSTDATISPSQHQKEGEALSVYPLTTQEEIKAPEVKSFTLGPARPDVTPRTPASESAPHAALQAAEVGVTEGHTPYPFTVRSSQLQSCSMMTPPTTRPHTDDRSCTHTHIHVRAHRQLTLQRCASLQRSTWALGKCVTSFKPHSRAYPRLGVSLAWAYHT